MKKTFLMLLFALVGVSVKAQLGTIVSYKDGQVEGIDSSGVKIFRGVPFAQPPVGQLRWKAPQPVIPWKGVLNAKQFAPDPMQHNAYGDIVFNGSKQSEDCLYLNIWTPAKTKNDKLPVLVYFNGGGLVCGSGSEARYQGLTLARRGGIIVVTANYREGIFGFFSHPLLTQEGACNGNQGWLDQAEAIKWVHQNISAFGGDPNKITINGESAGAQSVCAQTVSPIAKHLISGYMCSSGSIVSNATPVTLKESERLGEEWTRKNGLTSLEQMRALSAQQLEKLNDGRFGEPTKCIDGIFLTEDPNITIQKGKQAQVPALLGHNNAELTISAFNGGKLPTLENVAPFVQHYFGVDASKVYPLYNIHSDADLQGLAGYELGGDCFISYATWKWTDMVAGSSKKSVYRYVYCHPRPNMILKGKAPGLAGGTVDVKEEDKPKAIAPGAIHSADIEYAMGNLSTNTSFPWSAKDYAVSEIFQQIYINFVKYGNPNGLGVPTWQPYSKNDEAPAVMYIDLKTEQRKDKAVMHRYRTIDQYILKKMK